MELLLDPYLRELKDVQSKTIINEAINIFSCLNIAEKYAFFNQKKTNYFIQQKKHIV